jgi:hypothetical protein
VVNTNRSIITIATGKKLYVDLAVNLARSFIWWHPQSNIQFFIVTDSMEHIPKNVSEKVNIITIQPGELGEGFSSKLHLDKLAPEGQTLFIDSDCLIFKNLDSVFERFLNHSVSVIGNYVSKGEWFGNIEAVCQKFGLPHLPKFNGGIYYLEKGPMASKVYETARALEKQYDDIGFKRLRNRPNDEQLMSLAMQLHNQQPIDEDATIMSDPQACPGGYFIDVIKGKCELINPPLPNPNHQSWYPFEKVSPAIFHFLGYYTTHYPYKREIYRLEKAMKEQLSWKEEVKVKLSVEIPERLKAVMKYTFRPAYRRFFGIRKIEVSERI